MQGDSPSKCAIKICFEESRWTTLGRPSLPKVRTWTRHQIFRSEGFPISNFLVPNSRFFFTFHALLEHASYRMIHCIEPKWFWAHLTTPCHMTFTKFWCFHIPDKEKYVAVTTSHNVTRLSWLDHVSKMRSTGFVLCTQMYTVVLLVITLSGGNQLSFRESTRKRNLPVKRCNGAEFLTSNFLDELWWRYCVNLSRSTNG